MARRIFQRLAGLSAAFLVSGCTATPLSAADPQVAQKVVTGSTPRPEKPAPGNSPPAAPRKEPPDRSHQAARYLSPLELAVAEIRKEGVAIAYIGGIPAPGVAQFEQALRLGLQSADLKISAKARHRLEIVARLEPERQGSRQLTLGTRLLAPGDDGLLEMTILRQMPLPITDQHWKTLGVTVAANLQDKLLRPSR